MSPNEVFQGNYSETGQRNLSIYVYQGSVTITANTGVSFECKRQNLTDLQSITEGLVEYCAGDNGAAWLCINDNPRKKEFTFELLNAPTSKTITGSVKETYLLCIENAITCNGIVVEERGYARIKNGTQAAINIPANAAAILMTEK
jgi:hypothetical protein